jgi:hypothetical protein
VLCCVVCSLCVHTRLSSSHSPLSLAVQFAGKGGCTDGRQANHFRNSKCTSGFMGSGTCECLCCMHVLPQGAGEECTDRMCSLKLANTNEDNVGQMCDKRGRCVGVWWRAVVFVCSHCRRVHLNLTPLSCSPDTQTAPMTTAGATSVSARLLLCVSVVCVARVFDLCVRCTFPRFLTSRGRARTHSLALCPSLRPQAAMEACAAPRSRTRAAAAALCNMLCVCDSRKEDAGAAWRAKQRNS